jgi:hypothetical protein
MKTSNLSERTNTAIFKLLLIPILLLSSLSLKCQTPTDFSGRWEFDKAMSDKEERGDASFDGKIILEIKQNTTTIIFTSTYIRPGMEDYVMKPDTYFVDGRETTDNSGTGPARKFAKWSQDKKVLTTSLVMTDSIDGVAQEFLTSYTYKLSDDRKSLVIEEFHKSKLNGEQKIKKVYKAT